MGSGRYSADTHAASTAHKVSTGTPIFTHSATTRSKPRTEWKAHEDLDPKRKATDASVLHAGKVMRESLDSDEHPNALAIAVLFDVIEALDLAGIPPAVRAIVESARTSVLLGVTAEEVLAKIELVGDAWDGPPDFVGDGGGPGPMVLGVTPDLPENPEGGAE